MNDDTFTLSTTPAPIRGKRQICQNNAATRQTVLFAGLACLPGQNDLFPTDGKAEEPAATAAPMSREELNAALSRDPDDMTAEELERIDAALALRPKIVLEKRGEWCIGWDQAAELLEEHCGIPIHENAGGRNAIFHESRLGECHRTLTDAGYRVACDSGAPPMIIPTYGLRN